VARAEAGYLSTSEKRDVRPWCAPLLDATLIEAGWIDQGGSAVGTMHEKRSEAAEADVLEQEEPAGDESTGQVFDVPLDLGERPEADVLEQEEPVEEEQVLERDRTRGDVSEADWLEQSIEEPTEEQRR
jgi:hypothetical protein